MYFVLLDENSNILSKNYFDDFKELYSPSKKVMDVPKAKFLEVLTNLDYGVSIYMPYDEEGTDFVVKRLSKTLQEQCGLSSDESVKGCLFSEIFPIYVKGGIFDLLKEVYKTGKSRNCSLLGYVEDELVYSYEYSIVKSDESMFILANDDSKLKIAESVEEKTFNNSSQGLAILQDSKVVRCNPVFADFFGFENNNVNISVFDLLDVFDSEDQLKLKDIYYSILSGNVYMDEGIFKCTDSEGNSRWLSGYVSKTIFNNGLAIQLFCRDVSLEKEMEIKSKSLENDLNNVLDLGKIAVISWSKEKDYSYDESLLKLLDLNSKTALKNKIESIFPKYVSSEDRNKLLNDFRSSVNSRDEEFSTEFPIKTVKDNLKWVKLHVHSTYCEDGTLNSFLGYLQDITQEKLFEIKAIELQKNLSLIEDKSKFAVIKWDILNGHDPTSEFFNILELSPGDGVLNELDILGKFISKKDIENYIGDFQSFLQGKSDDFSAVFSLTTAKGNLKYISVYCKSTSDTFNELQFANNSKSEGSGSNSDNLNHNFDEMHKLTSFVGYIQDITYVTLKEKELEKSNKEKEILLKEVHHRVKNNLQIILSLLNLDERFHNDPKDIINSTKERINAMALAHEKTYQSSDLSKINVKDLLLNQFKMIFNLYSSDNVILNENIDDDLFLPMDNLTPLTLICNELVTNSHKYAFPEDVDFKTKEISISIKSENNTVVMIYKDNGVGFEDGFDIHNSSSLGLNIVKALVDQLEGNFEMADSEGVGLKIEFSLDK